MKPGKRLPDSDMERVFKGFQEIYRKYRVNVIGAWRNVDDPSEVYFIIAYQDESHYEVTVAKMRVDPVYVKLSEELLETRESVKVVTLKMLPS